MRSTRFAFATALGLVGAICSAEPFWRGGDVSELSRIETAGGRFFDDEGHAADALEILRDHGANLVRLRLYNDPGAPDHSPAKRMPKGYMDLPATLAMARRAHDLGFQIQLTLHYSDYWTNGERQTKPHAWDGLAFGDLRQALHDYTRDVLSRLVAQGTPPAFVSLGNEIQAGILFPDGSTAHWDNLAALLRAGGEAVKEVSPSSRIVLHLDGAADFGKYDYFFGRCEERGVPFDVIGASYYPFWTRKSPDDLVAWARHVHERFGKPILIMETGYNWHPVRPNGRRGQLGDNGGPDYPATPEGQLAFLRELTRGLRSLPRGAALGYLYWDPVMIEVPGVGWETGAPNVVSNTTLFDFSGRALPALRAFELDDDRARSTRPRHPVHRR